MEYTSRREGQGLSGRMAALMTGLALLTMLIIAPPAYYHFLPMGGSAGDIENLLPTLRQAGQGYVIGLFLLFGVYILDLVIAWGVYWFFRPDQHALGQLTAWTRLVYTALAMVGLSLNFQAYDLANSQQLAAALTEGELSSAVAVSLSNATTVMRVAWIFFGAHLFILALTIIRSSLVPFWVGIPVLLAALAYLLPISARYFAPDLDLGLLSAATPGELAFMLWLLIAGWRSATHKRLRSD